MKRVGGLTERICGMDNLLSAFHKAARGKWHKAAVAVYAANLEDNLHDLSLQIRSGDVQVGNYSYFDIYDPKLRTICAASFPERVLHHAIMNICHEVFERHFIYTTYATRPRKGVYAALDRACKAMKKYSYVGKFDVRHYFDSIDHTILKKKLTHLFKDKTLLDIFFRIIDSYEREQKNKGLPIGNLTSQYFANYYLSDFDHWCKEKLKAAEYIRYMDDFLVFCPYYSLLSSGADAINDYMNTSLALRLKPSVFANSRDGVSFLGYHIGNKKILLNSRSKKRLKKKMRLYENLLENKKWTEKEYMEHITPLLSFSRYAYSKGLRREIMMNGNK